MKTVKYKQIVVGLGFAALLGALSLTGCGKAKPLPAREDIPTQVFEVTGNDKMKFDINELAAKPLQKIELTFKNVGSMPKQSMGHNWVLLEPGTNAKTFVEAGMTAASTNYIAPSQKRYVIAATETLGPGESETITFTAPQKEGSYEYICAFPGHLAAGMTGVLKIAE